MSRVLIIFFFFLNFTYCFGQGGQANSASVSQNITNLFPEKVMVHSDKHFYISGEVMWFKVYVVEADSYLPESLSKTAYAELIDQNDKPLLQAKIQLIKGTGSGSFEIPLNAKSGSYRLRVYTNWMKNHPSSIFNKAITVINTQTNFDTTAFIISSNDNSLEQLNKDNDANLRANVKNKKPAQFGVQVLTDQKIYERRSPVKVTISAPFADSLNNANLSVAIYKVNDLNKPDGFAVNQDTENTTVENNPSTGMHTFLPEMNGYLVRVNVKNAQTRMPSAGVPIIISLTGKLTNLQYGESDAEGVAYFNLKNVFGPQQIFIKTTPEFENVVDFEFSTPFLNLPKASVQQRTKIKNEYLNDVEEMHNNLVITRAFTPDSTDKFYPAIPDSISFYGVPYITYLLDNYKRFVTMEEVLREYVKEVMPRIRDKNYSLLVFSKQLFQLRKYRDYANNMMDENSPLVLLDGIPVTDLNKLMKYDPLKVRKLEVVADRYIIGKKTYDGILSFTTYKAEFEDLQLNNKELLLDDDGWQFQRKFYMPDYNDPTIKISRIPDFRELLYWAPEVKTSKTDNGKISFFTGDLTGKFVIVVRGVSEDGRIVSEVKTFEVKK